MSSKDIESGFSESTPILHEDPRRHRRGSTNCSRFCFRICKPLKKLNQAIPARWALTFLGFCGFFCAYALRVNLSVAMVGMVVSGHVEHTDYESMACSELLSPITITNSNNSEPFQPTHGEFDWSPGVQSTILAAFFVGYVLTQIPGGILAEKVSATWTFGIGIFVTSFLTLLTPIAARYSVEALITVRFLEGVGEGVTFPAMNALIGRWVPELERSIISTIIFVGCPFGTVVSMSVSGYLSSSDGGWPIVFYLFGGLGCVWFVFWGIFAYESPDVHPRIGKDELQYIREGQNRNARSGRFPWRPVLTSRPFWALAITHFGYNWGFYTLLTELPTYLANILHFDLKHNGLLSALPYLCQTVFAFSAGSIADKMRASGRFRITCIRKFMNSIAFFIPGILVGSVALTGCMSGLIVTLIVASVAFSGCMYSGFNVTHVDMSPEFAGTLMGITNCIANLAGFLAPAYVGWAVKDGQTVENWGFVFVTTAIVYFVTGFIYDIFASAELQPWGVSQPPTAPVPPLDQETQDEPANEPPSEDDHYH